MRGLQLAELLEAARHVDQVDGIAADLPVGIADDARLLEVEGGEAGARNRRHLGHHHPQRFAHIDGRVDIEPAVRGERCDQLEMFGDRVEPAPDQGDLCIDDTRGAVDQQPFGGAGGAGQHDDVGDARDQRE